jgi:hypothetical protein
MNVRDYYACRSLFHTIRACRLTLFTALGHDKAQNIIDQITSAYESGGGPPPGGFSFGPPPLGPFNNGGPPPGYGAPVGFPGGKSLII